MASMTNAIERVSQTITWGKSFPINNKKKNPVKSSKSASIKTHLLIFGNVTFTYIYTLILPKYDFFSPMQSLFHLSQMSIEMHYLLFG